jgi:hypothetical protein
MLVLPFLYISAQGSLPASETGFEVGRRYSPEILQFCQRAISAYLEPDSGLLIPFHIPRGSQALASPRRGAKDIRQKILNYQATFRSGKYRVLDGLSGCSFQGFRLLVLANTPERMAFLCRLVQEMPPSDFVWVTDQKRMFCRGLADAIWARDGNISKSPESILNRETSRPSPVLPAAA